MSEKVIIQYQGFVQTHMSIIESGKHAGTPREGKIFYHVSDLDCSGKGISITYWDSAPL